MNRLIVPLIVVASVGLALSIAGLVITVRRGAAPVRPATGVIQPDYAAIGLRVPEFTMVNQSGEPRTEAMFDGRVTIMDFMFTHCPYACPQMSGAMSELSDKLRGTGVRLVSISVDPERDTPEQLREYGHRFGADFERWQFLSGDQETVDRIVRGSLQFALDREGGRPIVLPDGSTMTEIVHPTRLILVGADRNVLGMFDPNNPEDMRVLETKARVAARGPSSR